MTWRALLLTLSLAASANTADAQSSRLPVSGFVPRSHWLREAARRLHAAALTPRGFDPSRGTLTVAEMSRVLQFADSAAQGRALARVASELHRQFRNEFADADSNSDDATAAGRIFLKGTDGRGLVEPRIWLLSGEQTIPAPVANATEGGMGIAGVASLWGHVGLSVDADAMTEGVNARTLTAAVGTSGFAFFGGRYSPGYRTTQSGAVVLNGTAPFDGAGFFLTDPMRLPVIGPFGFELFLARGHAGLGYERPWFWTMRAAFEPFPWLGANVTRAAFAGTTQPGAHIELTDVLNSIIGQNGNGHSSEFFFDDQVVAVDGWMRPPVISPLMFYWDWGAEDSHGAWWHEPGQVFGLTLPAVPGAANMSIGIERVRYPITCCDVGDWYKHYLKRDGWVDDRAPLGHPLGGHGRETMLYSHMDLFDSRLAVTARGFHAHRGNQNIFAPTHSGASNGFGIDARLGGMRQWDVSIDASAEWGNGWSEQRVGVTAGWIFR